MATGPQIPRDPIELLTYDPTREPPFMNKYWGPGICATLAFSAVCFANWATKRPIFSGLQKHVSLTAAAAYVGKVVDEYRDEYFAERDAVLRHYIELHREEFPITERTKFADVIESWVPIR